MTTPCQHVITLSPGKRGGRPLHPRACECRGRSRLARRRYAHEEILGDFPESTGPAGGPAKAADPTLEEVAPRGERPKTASTGRE